MCFVSSLLTFGINFTDCNEINYTDAKRKKSASAVDTYIGDIRWNWRLVKEFIFSDQKWFGYIIVWYGSLDISR